MEEKDKITCEITRKVAVLSESGNGYTKELNFVSWNGKDPKLDIRSWRPDHESCGKGVTLTEEESLELYDALKKIYE